MRRASALLYSILALTIGTYAAKQFFAEYLAATAISSRSLSEARLAVGFFTEDPNAQQTLGILLLENGEHQAGVDALEKAADLRKHNYKSWQILGNARYAGSDLDGAEAAFRKSIALAPHYTEPNYLFGKLLLETGRRQQGFEALSKSAENNFPIFGPLVDLADKYYPNDAAAIQQAASPKTAEAKTYLARYFITRSLMTPDTLSFLFGNDISAPARNDFVNLLIEKQNFSLAHELWASTTVTDGNSDSDTIFDGGFEHTTGSSQGAFGWNVDQEIPGVSVSRTQHDPITGSYSLHVKFSGAASIGKDILSQLILVRPGSNYALKFYYRSPEILSASPPIILVMDPAGTELGRSVSLKGTDNGWVEASVNFVSRQTPAVKIVLLRPACSANPCPIFGELSLDDLSLVESVSR